MCFKSNASTRACVRSDDRNMKQNAVIAMAQATLEGFAWVMYLSNINSKEDKLRKVQVRKKGNLTKVQVC